MLCRDSDSGIGIPFSVQCVRFCLLSLCIHQCCISVSLTFGFAFSCDCDCVSLWINMPLTACSNIQRKGNTFCLFCFIVVWIFFSNLSLEDQRTQNWVRATPQPARKALSCSYFVQCFRFLCQSVLFWWAVSPLLKEIFGRILITFQCGLCVSIYVGL